jgi:hypothetical protein
MRHRNERQLFQSKTPSGPPPESRRRTVTIASDMAREHRKGCDATTTVTPAVGIARGRRRG